MFRLLLILGLLANPAAVVAQAEEPKQKEDPFDGLDHTGTPPLPPKADRQPPPSAEPGVKRPLPDYDGRPSESTSAGEALIWIPRVIFYPVHAVLEYAVRIPIVYTVRFAEEHYLIQKITRFFTFNEGKGGLFPTMFYDFGLSPSFGLYFFYDDLGAENNDLVLQAGAWPPDKYHFIATDSFNVFRNNQGTVTTRGEFTYRPDKVYCGLGPDSGSDRRFFRLRLTEAELCLRAILRDLHRVSLGLFFRNAKITGGKSPSVEAPDLPPGYGNTYNLISARVKLEFDSRDPERLRTPGSGLRLEAFSSFNIDPADTDLLFVRWGGELSGFLDLSGINHVLALRLYSEILEEIGDTTTPFTELIALGGAEHLRGFLGGRFSGYSALVATLDYRYPIHRYFDANIFTSIGNVFDGRLDNLHPKRMVMAWGIGIRSNTSRDVSFDIMVAFGTNQLREWDEEFEIDNVRFLVGINQGF